MSTETSPNQTKTLKDKVNRGLAYIGIGAALAGVLAEGAQASATRGSTANTASHIDKKPNPREYINDSQIPLEAAQALRSMRERWNGVVVIVAPKRKTEEVDFTASPHARQLMQGPALDTPYGRTGCTFIIDPGLVKVRNLNGNGYRTYLAVLGEYGPGFLDLKAAEDAGMVRMLAFKGSAPKPIPYKIGNVTSQSAQEVPTAHPLDTSAQDLKYLVNTIQPYTYNPATYKPGGPIVRKLEPSSVLPHL